MRGVGMKNVIWKNKRFSGNIVFLLMMLLTGAFMTGCGRTDAVTENGVNRNLQEEASEQQTFFEAGRYTVDFDTDSSMFHVNEACEGKGTLTVTEKEMVLHISLPSKNVVNLYPGLAEDAVKEGAALLEPTIDSITYSDGMTEEVHGFDIPVPVVGEEFDLALLGKKGKWYDHKVKVSNPVPAEDYNGSGETDAGTSENPMGVGLADGEYQIEVTLEGGSGRADVTSPTALLVRDGCLFVHIEWSSPYYDYIKVGDKTYYPINTEGNSVFELPISAREQSLNIIADTTAMGTPHEIAYELIFDFRTLYAAGQTERKRDISPAMTCIGSMECDFAEGFSVDHYDGGYALISLSDGSRFLTVPKDAGMPEKLAEDIVVLKQPVEHIYLVASAVMDMFVTMDALDSIALSGTKEDGWYITEAREAMKRGRIAYAGKYNMPDYERILKAKCSLAIESTMILHSPEVKENLEAMGIPVLIDRSSYESHPLGRTEWIKLYGVLLGKEKEAEAAFEEQKAALYSVKKAGAKQSVAFFYLTSNGMVSVRKSGDYVPKMIELAGGRYIFDDLGDETASSSMNMTMEEFYANASEADFLIYNSTIGGEICSQEELLQKCPLFRDFKAVKNGNVFGTTQNFYQESMKTGVFIKDVQRMLTPEEKGNEVFTYLYRLE